MVADFFMLKVIRVYIPKYIQKIYWIYYAGYIFSFVINLHKIDGYKYYFMSGIKTFDHKKIAIYHTLCKEIVFCGKDFCLLQGIKE